MPRSTPYSPLLADESHPTEATLCSAKWANRIATTAGMTSFGLLALIITHHILSEKDWPTAPIVIADAISFFTAVAGKVGIMLHFNEEQVLEGFKKICRKQLPDYFKLSEKSRFEKLQWAVNFLLNVNSSLFWAGLVEISFKKSGDLLNDKFDSKTAHHIGDQIKQWYIYLPFVLSSFYSNMVVWPSVLTNAYQQKKDLLCWLYRVVKNCGQYDFKREQLKEENYHVTSMHRQVLSEVKLIIQGHHETATPALAKLSDEKYHGDLEDTNEYQRYIIVQLDQLLTRNPQQLRQLYLENSDEKYIPISRKEFVLKHAIASGVTGLSIYGFDNIVGLSELIWQSWGAGSIAKFGGGILAFYTMAEIAAITVYPMSCDLFETAKSGVMPYVFSRSRFTLIVIMAFLIGLIGGFANGEASYIDGESTFDIFVSIFSALCVDSFGVYMHQRSIARKSVAQNHGTDTASTLKYRFLQLQQLGDEAREFNSVEEVNEEAVINRFDEDFEIDDGDTVHSSCPCTIL